MQFIGQKKVISLFEGLLESGGLHHAYAFVGPKSLGKETFAFQLASQVLNIPKEKLLSHPDYLFIDRTDEEGNLKKDITVEHIEKITRKIIQPPIVSKMHVVIISGAEKMNVFAANSLLKTLEEPPTPTIFFLLTQNEEKLLVTVRSRIQLLRFERVKAEEIYSNLERFYPQVPKDHLKIVTDLCDGLPGKAIGWLDDGDSFENYKKELQRFFSLFGKPLYEKIHLVEDLFGEKKAHIESRAQIDDILNIWLHGVSLLQKKGKKFFDFEPNCPQVAPFTSVALCDMILEAIELLQKNIHPRLVVEHILLRIS